MYRVLCILVLTLVVLVGCQANNGNTLNTPNEALDQIHLDEDYAEVMEIYETIDIDEGRVISVYKGSINTEEDIYIANIEKENGIWKVTDATNIGKPSADKLNQSSSTKKIQAGYKDERSILKENVKIIEMDESDYNIWIEVF